MGKTKADELREKAARATALAAMRAVRDVLSSHGITEFSSSERLITRELAFSFAAEIAELHDLIVESGRALPPDGVVEFEIVVGDEPKVRAA